MSKETTNNGIEYTWDITSIHGATFILYPKPGYSKEDIQIAKRQIKDERDVVSIRVATKYDLMDDYWGKIFNIGQKKHKLHWSQMDNNIKKLYKAYKCGMTPEQYVTNHVKEWKQTKIQKL